MSNNQLSAPSSISNRFLALTRRTAKRQLSWETIELRQKDFPSSRSESPALSPKTSNVTGAGAECG